MKLEDEEDWPVSRVRGDTEGAIYADFKSNTDKEERGGMKSP